MMIYAAVDGKLSDKEFYGIIYKCRGIHGILLQNLQISATDSMEICRRFHAIEYADLISAEA